MKMDEFIAVTESKVIQEIVQSSEQFNSKLFRLSIFDIIMAAYAVELWTSDGLRSPFQHGLNCDCILCEKWKRGRRALKKIGLISEEIDPEISEAGEGE